MEFKFASRLKNAWNAFQNKTPYSYNDYGGNGYYYRPDRARFTGGNEKSTVTSIYNRIATDVASIDFKHCRIDENERYKEDINSSLNNCLTLEANIDQGSKAFIRDIVISMLDEGNVAIVPVDISKDPSNTNSYDILTMRTGKVVEWYPSHVRVELYNDRKGEKEQIILDKEYVCLIENPFYAIMNEPNSTLQRLIRKLRLLDIIDEESSSGKLDLIIQLPYIIRSEARKKQANDRRKEIEDQLKGSKYGIAYTDGTEKITQLNRSVENNLLKQVEYLTNLLHSQLGITQSILDGTADDTTMLNYYSRTIEPITTSICEEMKRKFLTKTAISQGQTIMAFRNPFKLVPVKDLAELADKFTRNEIMSSNEIRQVIGIKPSDDPKADKLVNSNLNQSNEEFRQTYGKSNQTLNNINSSKERLYDSLSEEEKDEIDKMLEELINQTEE